MPSPRLFFVFVFLSLVFSCMCDVAPSRTKTKSTKFSITSTRRGQSQTKTPTPIAAPTTTPVPQKPKTKTPTPVTLESDEPPSPPPAPRPYNYTLTLIIDATPANAMTVKTALETQLKSNLQANTVSIDHFSTRKFETAAASANALVLLSAYTGEEAVAMLKGSEYLLGGFQVVGVASSPISDSASSPSLGRWVLLLVSVMMVVTLF